MPDVRSGPELVGRPADESVWESLRHAFEILIEAPATEGLDLMEVSRLFVDTPSLLARRFEKHQEWGGVFLPLLEGRLPLPAGAAQLELVGPSILAAALSCLDTATEIWVRHDGRIAIATTALRGAFVAVSAGANPPGA